MERLYGISYSFSKTPTVTQVSENEEIIYNPILVYCEKIGDSISSINRVQTETGFSLSYEQMGKKDPMLYQKDKIYSEMRKRSRDAQERIISEYICAVILQELRKYPNDILTFVINDEFQSEKFIGRLGYLKLPLDRTHIMFISRNIASFMTNYIEHYAIPPQNDLKLLFSQEYRGRVVGAYPEDNILSMLRTYFCSYEQEEIYPIRINLFSQALSTDKLNDEKNRIEKLFRIQETELYSVVGGNGNEKTRLPHVLVKCEDYIKNEQKK